MVPVHIWSRSVCPTSNRVLSRDDSFWFVSLDTRQYQFRNFSGSCLNCTIHMWWLIFQWNWIWGSRCRKGYHLLKECRKNRNYHIRLNKAWSGLSGRSSDMSVRVLCRRSRDSFAWRDSLQRIHSRRSQSFYDPVSIMARLYKPLQSAVKFSPHLFSYSLERWTSI